MQRPSNLILASIFAIASVFIAYAVSRIFFQIVAPPEIEIEEDYDFDRDSRLHTPQTITLIGVANLKYDV